MLALLACCALPGDAGAISDKDCQRPIAPEVPNATKASQVEMVSTRVRITMYLEAANEFLTCLDEAEKSVSETAREVKLNRIKKKREEIQAEMTTVTERYNEEVGRYKTANPPSEEEPQGSTEPAPGGETGPPPGAGPSSEPDAQSPAPGSP